MQQETLTAEGDQNTTPARAAWHSRLRPATRNLLARDSKAFLHQSLSTPCLDVIEAADGAWLTTIDGRRILDFHGNSAHQVGYGHPRVKAAIQDELEHLPFSPRRFTNIRAIELAERLGSLAPGTLEKVLFAPGGTSAVGMALKLARYATGRHKTISMWDSFHGASLDAISVGGEALFRRGAGPLLPGSEHVPPLDQVERFFGPGPAGFERLASYIDYMLEVQGDVAAIIAEPMRWTSVYPPPAGFWAAIRQSCDRHGCLLIFDEIPSGLGRSGTMFLCEQAGAVPDILVCGKGLGGAVMPIAALIARPELDLVAPRLALGHYTHEKSPLGCAAALATLDVIVEEALLARAARLGAVGLGRLVAMKAKIPTIKSVRGLGMYWGIELANPEGAAVAERVLYTCLENGLSFKIGNSNIITLCPPLNIKEDELDLGFGIVESALQKACN
ncbi:4-aminobutyrate aminotransferase apoenzyme [Arboricoccus pini]|uniref:4-aminobutyrate aminotransferase apoenzyme n=1 Tax=Arboricoccus pini TaxID=1963835 RepID=A0A212R7G0_9PROT|nr:aspartate aminotransferase family protein [Arboricoccus pini]SNB68131.1 4-aminobutyrate aminotransferase apoenzyme [Arboricoccus pini]